MRPVLVLSALVLLALAGCSDSKGDGGGAADGGTPGDATVGGDTGDVGAAEDCHGVIEVTGGAPVPPPVTLRGALERSYYVVLGDVTAIGEPRTERTTRTEYSGRTFFDAVAMRKATFSPDATHAAVNPKVAQWPSFPQSAGSVTAFYAREGLPFPSDAEGRPDPCVNFNDIGRQQAPGEIPKTGRAMVLLAVGNIYPPDPAAIAIEDLLSIVTLIWELPILSDGTVDLASLTAESRQTISVEDLLSEAAAAF